MSSLPVYSWPSSVPYVPYPITTDPDRLLEDAYSYLEFNVPGWAPAVGNLDVWLLEAMSRMVAEARDIAADVPDTIFRRLGNDLYRLPPQDATAAVATATVTLEENVSGYNIPAGLTFAVTDELGVPRGFQIEAEAFVPAPDLTHEVSVVALETGPFYNGLGPTNEAVMLDSWAGIVSIQLSSTSSSGTDAETDGEYMSRLSQRLVLLSPAPILPQDFALLAMEHPAVGRAVAIDGYDPGPPITTGNARTVAVVVADSFGLALSTTAKDEVEDMLEDYREVNFIVNALDPTYTDINVTASVVPVSGYDPVSMQQEVADALRAYLSPANWGSPAGSGGMFGDPYPWVNETKVRYLEITTVINNVPTVNYIVSCTVNGGTADITMTGAGPLPNPGIMTITSP
jgi:Baseplate J-like protein